MAADNLALPYRSNCFVCSLCLCFSLFLSFAPSLLTFSLPLPFCLSPSLLSFSIYPCLYLPLTCLLILIFGQDGVISIAVIHHFAAAERRLRSLQVDTHALLPTPLLTPSLTHSLTYLHSFNRLFTLIYSHSFTLTISHCLAHLLLLIYTHTFTHSR